jgi:hypothetical protein
MVFGGRSHFDGITTVVDEAITPGADTMKDAGERNFNVPSIVEDDVGAEEGGM